MLRNNFPNVLYCFLLALMDISAYTVVSIYYIGTISFVLQIIKKKVGDISISKIDF